MCPECIVSNHSTLPLHVVEVCLPVFYPDVRTLIKWIKRWDGTSFTRTTLTKLGQCIQLGHRVGVACCERLQRKITILHCNGIHEVLVYFCECEPRVSHRQQLLQVGWWPATPLDPQTVATFEVLRQFQYQNLQGNITAYDFYKALEMQTDAYQVTQLPVSPFCHFPSCSCPC